MFTQLNFWCQIVPWELILLVVASASPMPWVKFVTEGVSAFYKNQILWKLSKTVQSKPVAVLTPEPCAAQWNAIKNVTHVWETGATTPKHHCALLLQQISSWSHLESENCGYSFLFKRLMPKPKILQHILGMERPGAEALSAIFWLGYLSQVWVKSHLSESNLSKKGDKKCAYSRHILFRDKSA